MANHKQTKKRKRQTMKITVRNRHFRSTVRTYIKSVRAMIEAGEAAPAQDALKAAVKNLDRAVTKGIMKRETASRTISRLTLSVNKLSK